MPLQEAHETFIVGSIEHFFYDLPDDYEGLVRKISEFSNIFIDVLTIESGLPPGVRNEGESEEQYQFYLCIANPQLKFQHLENQHADRTLTVSEVLKFIYFYSMETLLQKLQPDNFEEYDELPEEFHEANELIASYSNPGIFQTTRPDFDNGLGVVNWSFDNVEKLKDKIYGLEIYFEPDEDAAAHVSLRYHLRIDADLGFTWDAKQFVIYPQNLTANQKIVFISQTKEDALRHVMFNITRTIRDHFPNDAFDEEKFSDIKFDLITHYYYAGLLFAREIKLNDLVQLSFGASKRLLSTSTLALLDSKIINFHDFIALPIHQQKLLQIPFYQQKFISENSTAAINNLSEQQCKTLSLPHIINLQSQKILNFDLAVSINNFGKKLLGNEFYFDLIMRNKLDIHQTLTVLSEREIKFLLRENIIALIGMDQIDIFEISLLADNDLEWLSSKLALRFIKCKVLTATQLLNLSPDLREQMKFYGKYNYRSLQVMLYIARDPELLTAQTLDAFIANVERMWHQIHVIFHPNFNEHILNHADVIIRSILTTTSLSRNDINIMFKMEMLRSLYAKICQLQDSQKTALHSKYQVIKDLIEKTTSQSLNENSLDKTFASWEQTFEKSISMLTRRLTRSTTSVASKGIFAISQIENEIAAKVSLYSELATVLTQLEQTQPLKQARKRKGLFANAANENAPGGPVMIQPEVQPPKRSRV